MKIPTFLSFCFFQLSKQNRPFWSLKHIYIGFPPRFSKLFVTSSRKTSLMLITLSVTCLESYGEKDAFEKESAVLKLSGHSGKYVVSGLQGIDTGIRARLDFK